MNITDIADVVKESVLNVGMEPGDTYPMYVFIETSGGGREFLKVPPFERDVDTEGKARRYFAMGRRYAKKPKNKKQGIEGLAMAVETWYVDAPPDKQFVRPSSSPQRKEGIVIAVLRDEPGFKHESRMYQLIRDKAGNVIDLLEEKQYAAGDMLSAFLPAFMAGVITVRQGKNDNDAVHILRPLLHKYYEELDKTGLQR